MNKDLTISKKKLHIIFVALFFFIVGYFFKGTDELDIGRYYMKGADFDVKYSLYDFVKVMYQLNFDFIYYVFFYLFKRFNIDFQFITGFFVSFYFTSWWLLNNSNRKSLGVYILSITSLFIILPISISRFLAAVFFLFIAINYLLKRKYIVALLLFILSIFTHVSMLLYIPLIISSFLFTKKIFYSRYYRFYMFFSILLAVFCGKLIVTIISNISFFDIFERYVTYLNPKEIGYSDFDFLMVLYFLNFGILFVYGLFNRLLDERYFKISFFTILFLIFCYTFSITMVQRTMILLAPLSCIIIGNGFRKYNFKSLNFQILLGIVFFNCFCFLFSIYIYRDVF